MNTITVKILVFVLSIFILITVAHQFSLTMKEDYKTETAMMHSSAEKVNLKGIYVRDESVINSSVTGVLSYPCLDGSKIAKNSVVAYIYKDENAIYINQQIAKLESEISLLESAQSPGTTDVAELDFISKLIDEKYQTITSLIAKNDLETLAVERKSYQSLLGIYQIIIHEETNYNDRINQLTKQLNSLKAKQKEPVDVVTVEDSGYFISYVDGYEKLLTPDKLDEIDTSLIQKVIDDDNSRKDSKYVVGKMVDGYEWYMIGIVNTSDNDFRVTGNVKLKFSSTPYTINSVIEDLIPTDNPDESIIVLSCDKLNYNFVQRRVERVEIILNDYEGVKIPRDAVRFNKNNEKGVYVLEGEKVSFRKVDVVFECDEYLLSNVKSDSNYVSIYDDIIVKGEVNPEQLVPEITTTAAVSEITVPDISDTEIDFQSDVSVDENDEEQVDMSLNSDEMFE